MYVNIIYIQDYDDTFNEVQEIFEENGYIAAIDFLAQWDYGYESEHMFSLVKEIENNPYHIYEEFYTHGEYTLIKHPLYMALYRKAYSEE